MSLINRIPFTAFLAAILLAAIASETRAENPPPICNRVRFQPLPGAETLADCVAFYARDLTCTVGGMPVRPQPGGFYGGWVTPDLAGPFKGDPGSEGW